MGSKFSKIILPFSTLNIPKSHSTTAPFSSLHEPESKHYYSFVEGHTWTPALVLGTYFKC